MQFDLKGGSGASLMGVLLILGFLTASVDPAMASQTKKHPKGFVHDTAGDGAPPAPITSYNKGGTPKWIQYDWGGLYWYQRGDTGKARQYWMEAFKEAEVVVPQERAKGLSVQTAEACCKLIKHLSFFVADTKFRPGYDSNYFGDTLNPNRKKGDLGAATANPLQYSLDNVKENLKKMQEDWDWWERICNFGDRAIGKNRDCMRQIYAQRQIFERKIIMTRQTGQQIEHSMGVDPRYSAIDTRPLKWGGVEGAGNPYADPNSQTIPLKYRGGLIPQQGETDNNSK